MMNTRRRARRIYFVWYWIISALWWSSLLEFEFTGAWVLGSKKAENLKETTKLFSKGSTRAMVTDAKTSDSHQAINAATKEVQKIIPLINLPDLDASNDLIMTAAKQVTEALKTSGFLLIKSDHLPLELQQKAIRCTTEILLSSNDNNAVITHPTDPKKYIMMESLEEIQEKCCISNDIEIITTYWNALEQVKKQVLMCMAIGLQLPAEYFINLHKQNNSALRLLHYPKVLKTNDSTSTDTEAVEDNDTSSPQPPKQQKQQPIIRCKPHSDYGSITLLLIDGIPGLQALINDQWIDVPYVEGALVVNIGSLLSEWTNGMFLATLHRVVGNNGDIDDDSKPRTSLAFFADPDQDISATLKTMEGTPNSNKSNMSVAEYIQWRSGGTGNDRSGLDFTEGERNRVEKAK